MLILLFVAALFLAYSNGANDNFKGVATLFGSRTTNYRTALKWATVTTFAGSICSVVFARTLAKAFTGKGLVPDALTASPEFLLAVGFGAAITVFLATLTGLPISTTHSITGALVGAGFSAVGGQLHFSVLQDKFLLPLLLSPALAMALSGLAYLGFRFVRQKFRVDEQSVLQVEQGRDSSPVPLPANQATFRSITNQTGTKAYKQEGTAAESTRRSWRVPLPKLLEQAHFLSAGLVSFARGLNDTPKIAALLLLVSALDIRLGFTAVGVGIALGGILNAKKVAITMSKNITTMNEGQGFAANLITGFLVIFASRMGVPVSTTHVSVGALSGIGFVTGQVNRGVLANIFLSWVLTLPIAAALSGVIYRVVS